MAEPLELNDISKLLNERIQSKDTRSTDSEENSETSQHSAGDDDFEAAELEADREDAVEEPSESFEHEFSDQQPLGNPGQNSERPGSITEYNSAVNYISDLIDQLRTPSDAKEPDELALGDEYAASELANRATYVLPEEQSLAEDDQVLIGDDNPLIADASSDGEIDPQFDRAPDHDTPIDEDFASENGYAYRRSLLHSLREAAHMATSMSLELNDCSKYAHRAYYTGFFGCACAFFSIIFVLMSPQTGTFGFAASVGAFSLAFALGLVYLISHRAFVKKAMQLRNAKDESVEPVLPISS